MEISPSIYEHAAKLIGETPWRVSRDPELLYQAHAEAYRTYRHKPIVPGIDIYNLEAEAYGAVVDEPLDNGIPAITCHPCSCVEEVLSLPPLDATRDGRIPGQIETAWRLAKTFPEAMIRIPVSGPFSIASSLLGFETLIIEMADRPELVLQCLLHLAEGQLAFTRGIKAAGVDATFFESAACPPIFSPRQFREVELPALKRILSGMGEILGRPVPCVIGGDTCSIAEAMLETGTQSLICPIETDQAAFLETVRSRPDVQVRVNCNYKILVSGTRDQIQAEADRVIALCRSRANCCFGTGALPYETPVENVHLLMRYVSDQ